MRNSTMAKPEPTNSTNARRALVFTALMGVALAAISLTKEQFGESDLTRILWMVALVGVMVGGVSLAYFSRSNNE